ncbi:MAG: hypothetical protein RR366_04940, partial [Clostridium sp.]
IGRAYRVSRISIFEDSDDGLSNRNTIEWCNEEIESFIAVSKVIGVFLLKQRLEEREKSRI